MVELADMLFAIKDISVTEDLTAIGVSSILLIAYVSQVDLEYSVQLPQQVYVDIRSVCEIATWVGEQK